MPLHHVCGTGKTGMKLLWKRSRQHSQCSLQAEIKLINKLHLQLCTMLQTYRLLSNTLILTVPSWKKDRIIRKRTKNWQKVHGTFWFGVPQPGCRAREEMILFWDRDKISEKQFDTAQPSLQPLCPGTGVSSESEPTSNSTLGLTPHLRCFPQSHPRPARGPP